MYPLITFGPWHSIRDVVTQITRSSLVQVMTWRRTMMIFFVVVVNGALRNKLQWNLNIIWKLSVSWRIYRWTWWRHQMETFSALLALCAGNSPVTGEFPAQRPVTQSFDVFFDLHLNKRLSKQSWGRLLETPSRPLWRHSNDSVYNTVAILPRPKCDTRSFQGHGTNK